MVRIYDKSLLLHNWLKFFLLEQSDFQIFSRKYLGTLFSSLHISFHNTIHFKEKSRENLGTEKIKMLPQKQFHPIVMRVNKLRAKY